MANTYKGRMFINEPMDGKLVTDVPGIGEVTATILKENGYEEAEDLYKVFLECECNKAKFQKWMRTTCKMVPKVSDLVYDAFDSWHKNFHTDSDEEGDNSNHAPKPKRVNSGSDTGSATLEDFDKLLSQKQFEFNARSHALEVFFIAMAKKVALLAPSVQDQVEKKVYDIVMEAKAKIPSMEAMYQPAASANS